jgi:eukaryotic translation initiation factor 2C
VVDGKGIGRQVIDKLLQTYGSELAGKDFAYDGEKCLFTVGPLPQNNFEFTVFLEETSSRSEHLFSKLGYSLFAKFIFFGLFI